MQTFMPVAPKRDVRLFGEYDFSETFAVLDRQRLGKQRVETMQLVSAITNQSGWKNHPAAKMWSRYVPMLIAYGVQCCDEWVDRGYQDTVRGKLMKMYRQFDGEDFYAPWWFGIYAFHQSHRSNLLRKLPHHYRQYWPAERDDLPYIWPF